MEVILITSATPTVITKVHLKTNIEKQYDDGVFCHFTSLEERAEGAKVNDIDQQHKLRRRHGHYSRN